ncbi:minor capsid protein [Clostridium perfringens]|nr:minor capsid protein [Clostridium perfringens]
MKKFNYDKDIKGFNKLTKGQQFFVSNFIEFAQELYDQGEKALEPILKLQNSDSEQLLNLISKLMLEYEIKDNILNLTEIQKRKIIKTLDKEINSMFKAQCESENEVLTSTLHNIAREKYNINNYLLAFGMSFEIQKIKEIDLKRILNHKVKGENYSKRIWKNRNKIAKQLRIEIRDFCNGNTNVNEIAKKIRKRFEVNKFLTERLVRNEICRVQNEVNEQFFEDNGAVYLLYSATLDAKTCSICKGYDGNVYRFDEDRPSLPIHVNDRCTYIQLPDKDFRPTKRLNNITKENIDYQTFKEWESTLK